MCKKVLKPLALAAILLSLFFSFVSCQMESKADIYKRTQKRASVPYNVTYILNGGTLPSGKKNPDSFDIESKITLISPSKNGYTFDGWYDPYGKKITILDESVAFDDLVLTARFTPINYTITYYLYKGVNNGENPSTYNIEQEISLATPTKNNRIFAGWYTTSDRRGTPVTKIGPGRTGNLDLYARWKSTGASFDIDDEGIGNFTDWVSEAIEPSETDNVIVIEGDATQSDLRTLSSVITANSEYIEEIDLSELNVTQFYNSGSGAGGNNFLGNLKNVKKIILPESLEIVSEGAFAFCSNLEEVVLHEGITDILWSAFCGPNKIKEITLPDSVEFIAQTAFYECYDLEKVNISKNSNLILIGADAFYNCTSLTSFFIPSKLTYIDKISATTSRTDENWWKYGPIRYCTKLATITFCKTLTGINSGCFEGCNNITTINYEGTEEEWQALLPNIGSNNGSLLTATVNYNYVIP